SWPSKGRIEFEDLKLRYRSNAPLVLKGITCTFKEGTQVGIVGRTGLKDLRMKLSVIPQEPTLFRGSIRTNLDPLGLHSDDDIWKAFEKCQLKSTIQSLPNLLDSSVSDEGENWSAGQRQLFCLGRVLLRRNKILVLDEATTSIDSATDVILQRIIKCHYESTGWYECWPHSITQQVVIGVLLGTVCKGFSVLGGTSSKARVRNLYSWSISSWIAQQVVIGVLLGTVCKGFSVLGGTSSKARVRNLYSWSISSWKDMMEEEKGMK
ncbi:ABC transporter C family member 8, partial [Tanacetum coccineum]